ncbi:MAG: ABC transporter permease, partial [Oscillospiraceae bacterium]|nr:ABC transporter permease [Oscillospiraceae bacterium]
RYDFDVQISFFGAPEAGEMIQRLEGVEGLDRMRCAGYESTVLRFNGKEKEVVLYAIEDTELVHIVDLHENPIPLSEDGIVLERHAAEALDVAVGDTVSVNGTDLRVDAICDQTIQYVQFISVRTFERIRGQDAVCCVLADMDDPAEQIALGLAVKNVDGFDHLTFSTNVSVSLKDFLSGMMTAVYIVIVCGVSIGVLIVYNISSINFAERKREYAILMTQGEKPFTILLSTYSELLAEFLAALLLTLLFAEPFTSINAQIIGGDLFEMRDPHLSLSVLYSALLSLGFLIAANALAMRQLWKIDLADALKARE